MLRLKSRRVDPLPPPAFFRRRRWWRRLQIAGGMALLVLLWAADRAGWLGHAGSDLQRYDGRSFRVVAVVDGDTLDVEAPDGSRSTTRVRVWGIDCPEMAREGRPAEPWAEQATRRARELAYGRSVRLTLQPHRIRDRFGRLLAFVELPGGRDLAGLLLSEGLTLADERWPHDRLEDYAQRQQQARQQGRRLWAPLMD